eukprot:UN00417
MIQTSIILLLAINILHVFADASQAPIVEMFAAAAAAGENLFDCLLFECDNWSDRLCNAESINYDEDECDKGRYCCSDGENNNNNNDETEDIIVSLSLSNETIIYLWVFVISFLVVNAVLFYVCYFKKQKGKAVFETNGGLQV